MWVIYVIGIGLVGLLISWIHFHMETKKHTDKLTDFAGISSVFFIALTCVIFFWQLVEKIFGAFDPVIVVIIAMSFLLCTWTYVASFRRTTKAPETLVYLSVSAVLIAAVALILSNIPNSDVEDATLEVDSLRSASKEKEVVKARDLALKQTEKETVELLQQMAVLNASTQLQMANLSLQATAVESDAKVQIAKTNAEKEVRIAELETRVKLAETDVKLKSEQVKASIDAESLKMKLEEARIEMIKLEKDMEMKVAKANAEKEIRLAQEAAMIREKEAIIKQHENMVKLLQVELAEFKTAAEISRKYQENASSSTTAVAVVASLISVVVAIAVSSSGVEQLRRVSAAVRGYMSAILTDDTTQDDTPIDSQQRKTVKFGFSRRSDTDHSKKVVEAKLSDSELRTKPG